MLIINKLAILFADFKFKSEINICQYIGIHINLA